MEIKFIDEKVISGFSIRTDNATEMSATDGKIPSLWQRFDQTIPVDYKNGERVYGVYSDYESDHTGKFNVLAGFDGPSFPANLNVEQITIPAAKYLVFTHRGTMPQIAIDAWTQVWQYFNQDSPQHQRLHSVDFEYYPNGNQIEVCIAIK